MDNALTAKNAV